MYRYRYIDIRLQGFYRKDILKFCKIFIFIFFHSITSNKTIIEISMTDVKINGFL